MSVPHPLVCRKGHGDPTDSCEETGWRTHPHVGRRMLHALGRHRRLDAQRPPPAPRMARATTAPTMRRRSARARMMRRKRRSARRRPSAGSQRSGGSAGRQSCGGTRTARIMRPGRLFIEARLPLVLLLLLPIPLSRRAVVFPCPMILTTPPPMLMRPLLYILVHLPLPYHQMHWMVPATAALARASGRPERRPAASLMAPAVGARWCGRGMHQTAPTGYLRMPVPIQ